MYNAFLSSPEFPRLLETLTLEAANLKQEWPMDPRLWLSEVRAFLIRLLLRLHRQVRASQSVSLYFILLQKTNFLPVSKHLIE